MLGIEVLAKKKKSSQGKASFLIFFAGIAQEHLDHPGSNWDHLKLISFSKISIETFSMSILNEFSITCCTRHG